MELEPPKDMVIMKAMLPSNRLTTAISQINDWKTYISQNPMALKQDLTEKCMKKDLLREMPGEKGVSTNFTGNYLNAIDTVIFFNYYIVISMRENLNQDQRTKMNQIRQSSGIEIFSFIRIFDVARQHDKYHSNPLQSVRLNESEEE